MTQVFGTPMPWPYPDCSLPHTIKVYDGESGRWIRGEDDAFGLLIQGNGVVKFRMRCRQCGRRSSDIPAVVIKAWAPGDAEWVEVNRPAIYQPCTVLGCPEPGCDRHHFAPRNTFGTEADAWPVLPLCRGHHLEWHTRMDGYRWHAKRNGEAA